MSSKFEVQIGERERERERQTDRQTEEQQEEKKKKNGEQHIKKEEEKRRRKEGLSCRVLRLRADGQLSKWTDKWFPRAVCPPTPSGPKVIALPHVEGVLLVLPVGTGLALLTLALEVVYRRRHAVS